MRRLCRIGVAASVLASACTGRVSAPADGKREPPTEAAQTPTDAARPDGHRGTPPSTDAAAFVMLDAQPEPPADTRRDAASEARAPSVATATNPVLAGDHPDPGVTRVVDADGRVTYYLVATVDTGDLPIYQSADLIHWTLATSGAFGRQGRRGESLEINGRHYCSIWAPQIVRVDDRYLLAFSALRYDTKQAPCPGYAENGGIFFASAASPVGPFAVERRPHEPAGVGAAPNCAPAIANRIPHSLDTRQSGCLGGPCAILPRLDPAVFRDPLSQRWWLAYAWYTNGEPTVPWEIDNLGSHVSVTELDRDDPFVVRCDPAVPQVFAMNCHDEAMLTAVAKLCAGCDQQLSMTKMRDGSEQRRGAGVWGIAEGPSLFRRGGYVYLLTSGSWWDSAYYHVLWTAAPTVEELAYDNPRRLVGRYLVPSDEESFGHGEAVLGPNGRDWFYVHHRLDHRRCVQTGGCSRDVWVSPIEFEDRGDGRGDVHIKARFPAHDRAVTVRTGG